MAGSNDGEDDINKSQEILDDSNAQSALANLSHRSDETLCDMDTEVAGYNVLEAYEDMEKIAEAQITSWSDAALKSNNIGSWIQLAVRNLLEEIYKDCEVLNEIMPHDQHGFNRHLLVYYFFYSCSFI